MIPRICAALRDMGALPGVDAHARLSTIKVHTTAIGGGALVSLLFAGDEPDPRFVVRIPRDPSRTERVLCNYRTLQALQNIPAIALSVPAPVFSGEVLGVPTTVETFVYGAPAEMDLLSAFRGGDQQPFLDLLQRASTWLRALHIATARKSDPPRSFAVEWADLAVGAGLIEERAAEAAIHTVCLLPAEVRLWSRRHGDFAPNNLLLRDGTPGLAVVDWEYSEDGYPLFDLLDLVVQSYVQRNAGAVRVCIEELIAGESLAGRAVHAAIATLTAGAGVDAPTFRALMAAYALEWLSRDARRGPPGLARTSHITLAMLACGIGQDEELSQTA